MLVCGASDHPPQAEMPSDDGFDREATSQRCPAKQTLGAAAEREQLLWWGDLGQGQRGLGRKETAEHGVGWPLTLCACLDRHCASTDGPLQLF